MSNLLKRVKRTLLAARQSLPDRWVVVDIIAAALLGAGAWEQWGRPVALMLLGALLLSLAILRAALLARAQRRRD